MNKQINSHLEIKCKCGEIINLLSYNGKCPKCNGEFIKGSCSIDSDENEGSVTFTI